MSEKLTSRQSAFIANIKENISPAEAYTRAGYTAKTKHVAEVSANKLLKHPEISKQLARHRTQELSKKAKLAESVQVSQEWVIQQYIVTLEEAREAKQFQAVRGCLSDISKLCGLIVDRKELAVSGEVSHLANIDTRDLLEALKSAEKPRIIEQS